MRNLTIDYSFTAGTRAITVAGEPFTVENIRLIVNETQKKVLCSSMQKDLIVSVVDNVITYSNSLPALVAGDKLTIELDNGVLPIFSANAELAEGKTLIAENLTTMGVTASPSESLTSLGNKVLSAGLNVKVVSEEQVFHVLAPLIVISVCPVLKYTQLNVLELKLFPLNVTGTAGMTKSISFVPLN